MRASCVEQARGGGRMASVGELAPGWRPHPCSFGWRVDVAIRGLKGGSRDMYSFAGVCCEAMGLGNALVTYACRTRVLRIGQLRTAPSVRLVQSIACVAACDRIPCSVYRSASYWISPCEVRPMLMSETFLHILGPWFANRSRKQT